MGDRIDLPSDPEEIRLLLLFLIFHEKVRRHGHNDPNLKKPHHPASLIGRDEMNLAEFPIALIADRAGPGRRRSTSRISTDG